MIKIGDCASCISDCTAALQVLPGAFRPLLKRAEAYETSEKYVPIKSALSLKTLLVFEVSEYFIYPRIVEWL